LSRQERSNECGISQKDIYLYPLDKDIAQAILFGHSEDSDYLIVGMVIY
jgi:hypothetical protein